LVEASLLRRDDAADDGEGEARFRMLETIREFGLERLAAEGEEGDARRRHAGWCLELAEEAEPLLVGRVQGRWLGRLAIEHDNLRGALGWALDGGEPGLGLRLAAALWRFWLVRGHLSEGRRWLRRALEDATDQEPTDQELPVCARALAGAASLAQGQGDYEDAVGCYEASLTICRDLGDRRGAGRALIGLGVVAANRGTTAEATARLEEGLALAEEVGDDAAVATALAGLGHLACDLLDFPRAADLYTQGLARLRALGDPHGVAAALNHLGIVARLQGDFDGAVVLQEQSLALRREMGDRQGEAAALNNLANVAFARGDVAAAVALHEESLALERRLGNRYGIAASLHNLASIWLDEGELERAADLFRESLAIFGQVGDRLRLGECLIGLALVAAAGGQDERAARLVGAAEGLGGWQVEEDAEYAEAVAALRSRLGTAAFAAASAAGSTLSLDQALAEAALGVESERPTLEEVNR
jgi:tetratricopeptide (TPR) repeat protein